MTRALVRAAATQGWAHTEVMTDKTHYREYVNQQFNNVWLNMHCPRG
jgi:hypothetical protein